MIPVLGVPEYVKADELLRGIKEGKIEVLKILVASDHICVKFVGEIGWKNVVYSTTLSRAYLDKLVEVLKKGGQKPKIEQVIE